MSRAPVPAPAGTTMFCAQCEAAVRARTAKFDLLRLGQQGGFQDVLNGFELLSRFSTLIAACQMRGDRFTLRSIEFAVEPTPDRVSYVFAVSHKNALNLS